MKIFTLPWMDYLSGNEVAVAIILLVLMIVVGLRLDRRATPKGAKP